MRKKGIKRKIYEYASAHRWRKGWRTAVSCLACAVVFCTVYALILPAITMESEFYCGKTEHVHSEECYEKVLSCTMETASVSGNDAAEHVHTEDCYTLVLSCGLEEHTHTLACASDPEADTETEELWEGLVADVELTGVWPEDLLAIAQSQLGYSESARNYLTDEEESLVKGYTRYGAWYGRPYDDWCAMFVSFCLNYADIPEEVIPREADVQLWVEKLSGCAEGYEDFNLYFAAEDYVPKPGDLIFLDQDGDGYADHMGIVAEYTEDSLSGGQIKCIEGDSDDRVQYKSYEAAGDWVMGYAILPANPEFSLMALQDSGYEKLDGFYLWLRLQDRTGAVKAVYDNPEWIEGTGFSSNGIDDALKYTDAKESSYLIPVSYFTEAFGEYGYRFDPADTADCPFLYAPDANHGTADLTAADYVYVEETATEEENSGWYVRVKDTTGLMPNRSNIYYTYFKTQEVGAFRLWQFAKRSSESDYTMTAGYDGDAALKDVLQMSLINGTCFLIPVSYFIQNYGSYGYRFDPADTGACPFLYAPSAYESMANLTAASYVYVESRASEGDDASGWYVQVEDTTGLDPNRSNVYYNARASVVSDAVTPSGTVINLFDYWVKAEIEDDINEKDYAAGINAGHALKFKPTGLSGANAWTGDSAVYPGIVARRLGADGYPMLSGAAVFGVADGSTEMVSGDESLAYLFDPAYDGESAAYRKAYRNVGGLLQVNDGGYYYYDSTQNYADFDETANRFTLYNDWAITYTPQNGNATYGHFFPFDDYDTVSRTTGAGTGALNHYFGMTLTARFIQQYGGHTDASQNTNMIFDFSGDDDVWIFIDGVLVADLGGIHDAASVDINFATGNVTVNGVVVTTIKQAFIDAGQASAEDAEDWNGNTFADETYHTLKFYYLERGSYASNLKLTYNLNSYPPTSIYKVNQYGGTVEGAGFAIYAANENYELLTDKDGEVVDLSGDCTYDDSGNIVATDGEGNVKTARALYTGTTDKKGEMIFLDEDDVPYTLSELKGMFGEYFILKEIEVPTGYRLVNDTIKLHIYNDKILMCENTYDSGVYASASLQVAAPNLLKKAKTKAETDGEADAQTDDVITYVREDSSTNGILFAVVLKYIGERDDSGNAVDDLKEKEVWAPVYGTNEAGFTIVDVDGEYGGDFIAAAIATAKLYKESQNVFALSAGGQMQGEIVGMPGDITTYYYMLPSEEKEKTQYTVAYYWSSAESLEGANSGNTCRIDGEAEGYALSRSFGATIKVPNLLNRLVVQKLNEEGELINGARFALYDAEEMLKPDGTQEPDENGNAIYYVGEDPAGNRALIYLYPDDGSRAEENGSDDGKAGNNQGAAYLQGKADNKGSYQVDSTTGIITVAIPDEGSEDGGHVKYIIKPADTAVTLSKENKENTIGEDGSASFVNMSNGNYYLREISVPIGYELNTTEVMVRVDDTAVYANAGTAKDGVTVARGPGYVVYTLDQFASQGQIDNTLSWVYEQLLVSEESNSFQEVYNALAEGSNWKYLKAYNGNGYFAATETTSGKTASDKAAALTTHLMYDKGGSNTLFNYTVNAGRYENGDITNVTRRLYTSVGWSYYLLYQDYDYGIAHREDTANYTDLREEGDISNLFSRSTFVQVTDKRQAGRLIISKKVEEGGTKDTTSFSFTVNLKDSDGKALTGSYDYTIYNVVTNDEGERVYEEAVDENGEKLTGSISYAGDAEGNDADGTGTCSAEIALKDGQAVIIEELPYGACYTVTETQNTRYSTTAVRDQGKAAISGIANTGEKEFIGHMVTGTLYWIVKEGELDNTSTAEFINRYLSDLLIWKVDAEDEKESLEGAEFTLTKKEGEKLFYFTGSDGTEEEAWSETEAKLTTNEYGYITLDISKLGNGTYTLMEVKAPEGYYLLSAAVSVTIEEGRFTKVSANSADQEDTKRIDIADDGLSLIVSNVRGYELPNTGGAGNNLFTFSGLLLMAGAVGYGYGLRRRRERREKN